MIKEKEPHQQEKRVERHYTFLKRYNKCRPSKKCAPCNAGGPGHGLYWYAYYREQGLLHCLYLGKENTPEALRAAEERERTRNARRATR